MADKHGGREVKGNDHYEGIETPFKTHKSGESGPHEGSDPGDFAKHQDHVRETFHVK